MVLQRGSVVLIPFPFTDLSATKTRPAVVISSSDYHTARNELLLTYVSSQMTKATPPLDYILKDWQKAGLLKPSFIRPKMATIEPSFVAHHIGYLSAEDLWETEQRLRLALALSQISFDDVIRNADFTKESPALLEIIAVKSITALMSLVKEHPSIDLERIRRLLDDHNTSTS